MGTWPNREGHPAQCAPTVGSLALVCIFRVPGDPRLLLPLLAQPRPTLGVQAFSLLLLPYRLPSALLSSVCPWDPSSSWLRAWDAPSTSPQRPSSPLHVLPRILRGLGQLHALGSQGLPLLTWRVGFEKEDGTKALTHRRAWRARGPFVAFQSKSSLQSHERVGQGHAGRGLQGCLLSHFIPRLASHSPLDQEALGPQGNHVILEGHLSQGGLRGLGHPENRVRNEFSWSQRRRPLTRPRTRPSVGAFSSDTPGLGLDWASPGHFPES